MTDPQTTGPEISRNPALPHPKTVFDLWGANDIVRLDEMVARRHALLQREAEQEATR